MTPHPELSRYPKLCGLNFVSGLRTETPWRQGLIPIDSGHSLRCSTQDRLRKGKGNNIL